MNNTQNTQKKSEIIKAKSTTPAEKQIGQVFDYPCIFSWSDGHQSKTTLSRAFHNEDSYKRYAEYKRTGKPYPVKIEAVAPVEPAKASAIFPNGTAQVDYGVVQHIADDLTTALKQYLEAERS